MTKLCFALLICGSLAAAPIEQFGYHEVKLDASGKIVPWYGSGPSEAYSHVIGLVWNFWRGMRACDNGVPYYLQHQVWRQEIDDQRGLGGDQISMALSSWNLLYGYSGDPGVRADMIRMADHWLTHGISAADLMWGSLPYPYNMENHSGVYDGDMRAGKGSLQPDKAGSFGAELLMLYQATGEQRYLAAARAMAATLVRRHQPGDEEHSPWPFRVHAATGTVHEGRAGYTSNWTGTLRLLDGLAALGDASAADYRRVAAAVREWMERYPVKTNKWGPFFEDIPTRDYSDTEVNADTFAAYLIEHRDQFPAWRTEARNILDWSFRTFANHEFERWGVTAINEQTVYRVPGNSHTSRHASVELMYCEATGDCERKDASIRQLNWATYTVDTDGRNRYPRDDIWLTDGYGDYVRHYLRAMAAAPELAPDNENHLLRTTSVIQTIEYGAGAIRYTKFDARSQERFKLGMWTPRRIQGGEMQWDAAAKVLTVKTTAKTVVIER